MTSTHPTQRRHPPFSRINSWHMGSHDQHLQIFPILKCCLQQLKPNQTCLWTTSLRFLGSALILLCLSLPELHPRPSHVITSSRAPGPTMMHICILDAPHSATQQKPFQFINEGGTWDTFPFFPILRTQCHHRRATFIYYLETKTYESAELCML